MLIEEIIGEGYVQTWGRGPKGVVRRYRCTDGPKKNRVVAKPTTCSTAVSQKKSHTLKKTRRTKGRSQAVKRAVTMKRPTSGRISAINKATKRRSSGSNIRPPKRNRKTKR
jgi:hypothetical protein